MDFDNAPRGRLFVTRCALSISVLKTVHVEPERQNLVVGTYSQPVYSNISEYTVQYTVSAISLDAHADADANAHAHADADDDDDDDDDAQACPIT